MPGDFWDMRSLLVGLIAFAARYLVYNGTTSYAEIPSTSELSVSANGLTVAVWMRPDALTFPKTQGSVANQRYVHWLGKGSSANGDEEWTFRMYSQTNPAGPRANRISFYVFNPTGGLGCGSYFQDPVTPGQWIHIVAVVDASAQTTAIYKNGVLRNTNSYAGKITPTPGAEPMRFGSKDLSSFFQGAIGPVRIWSRPLTASEVSALYGSGAVPQSGLVAEYLTDAGRAEALTLFNTTWGSGPRTPMSTATASQSGGGC